MQIASEMENPEAVDPSEYIRQKEEFEDKRDEFMRKHLRRSWPVRIVTILGIFQLLVSLAILGVDLPIILMFAPRWQIFAGCWAFVFGFIACVATLHSTRKLTWSKLKWAVAFNIIGGLAAAIMTAFDILYLVNSNMCLVVSGCNYLSYTYSAVPSYYTGQVILGIIFLVTVFIFLILFIKYGIGGTTLFENIQKGWAPAIFNPIVPPDGGMPPQPAPGPGVMNRPPPPGAMPRYPAQGPGAAMYGPPRMPGPRPGMMPMPRGPMMQGPGPRGPPQAFYRPAGPYQGAARYPY